MRQVDVHEKIDHIKVKDVELYEALLLETSWNFIILTFREAMVDICDNLK